MNGETGECNTPVRRSSRARKPNSRFADDELDGCIKKIVKGVTPSETAATLGASPVRQKKGGKKRESGSEERGGGDVVTEEKARSICNESADKPLSTESQFTVSENKTNKSSHVPDINIESHIQHDIVNGILNETEVGENMGKAKSGNGKPQERKTRSIAKKEDSKSFPEKDGKRVAKKGGKAKSKGGDVESIQNAKIFGQSNSEVISDGLPPASEKSSNIEGLSHAEKEKLQLEHANLLPTSVEECDAKVIASASSFQDDKNIGVTSKSFESCKQLEHIIDKDSSEENTSELVAVMCDSTTNKKASELSPQDDFVNAATSGSCKSVSKNAEACDEASDTTKPVHTMDKSFLNVVGDQELKSDCVGGVSYKENNEILTKGVEAVASSSPASAARSEEKTSSSGGHAFSNVNPTETMLSSPARLKDGVDFSEAETSTPSQRGDSNSKQAIVSPQHCSGHSDASEKKTTGDSCHKEQGGSSDPEKSVLSVVRLQKSSEQSKIKVIKKRVVGIKLVEKATLDEKSISEGVKDVAVKLSGGNIEVPESSERGDKTESISKLVESSFSTPQSEENTSLIDSGAKDNSVSKGKRNRMEAYGDSGNIGQSATKFQESPKAKKRRDDMSAHKDTYQEAQKRKHQEEPEDGNSIKRKKKDDFPVAATAGDKSIDGEAVQEIPLPDSDNSDQNVKNTQALSSHNSDISAASPRKDISGEIVNKTQMNVKSSSCSKERQSDGIDNDDDPDVEERRHSSIGSILSLLKRPDVAKKIVDNSESKSRWSDRRSGEGNGKEDKKRKSADIGSNQRGDRKQKTIDAESREKAGKWHRDDRKRIEVDESYEKDKGKCESFHTSKPRRERKLSCEGSKVDSFKEESRSSDEDHAKSSKSYKTGSTGVDKVCDWEAPNMTWSAFKDSTPLSRDNQVKIPKKFIEPESGHRIPIEEENNDIEERRSSSIGNILSFLKRSGQSGTQPKQDDSHTPSESGRGLPAVREDKSQDFSERERSTACTKEESFIPCSRREDDDQNLKSKKRSHYKGREGRVSRWSAREESPDVPHSKWESTSSSSKNDDKSDWSDRQDTAGHSYNSWEDVPQHPIQVLVSSNKSTSKHSLSGKEHNKFSTYGTWNKQNVGWKNWTENQTQRSYMDQKETLDAKHIAKRVIESDKYNERINVKDSVSDEENVDFSNREGLSEFIESIAGEIDHSDQGSGDISPKSSQQHGYHSDVARPAWFAKNESSLSPNGDSCLSPQREPPLWSPRSSEVVLSPKSRELMSSLRNMEVKLTPQLQEIVSQKSQYDSIQLQQSPDYPLKEDDASSFKLKDGSDTFDIHNIPLPPVRTTESASRYTKIGDLFDKSEFQTEQLGITQFGAVRSGDSQEGRKTFEKIWENHDKSFDSSFSSKYGAIESESEEEKKPSKNEYFEVKESFDDDCHDKENLKPTLKNLDDQLVTEEEKDEFQSKTELDASVKEERNKEIVEDRMRSFIHLRDNLYLGDRKKSKRSKEVRRMVCDCSLTKEEIARGEVGCGEDCLNRLLMIECGSRCSLKDRCINKRFQNYDYANVEVFNADEKGCGIRACSDIPAGTFIMEYVGEVFDSREFKRRRKEYAKNNSAHFYFMALKGDLFIDATRKGNISRFINHSCDPNAQTQKWTVNGELRVGFFAAKDIAVGEEINFDYRLERYGREPQRCFCGTAVCRGWLGESPDEKTKEEKEEEKRLEKDKRRREEKRSYLEDAVLEEEIEKLNTIKLKTRQDILNLCRLMVRADNFTSRVKLLQLVQTSTSACKRLFMDYHGLSVLWSWMADLGYAHEHASIKIEILKTLECLPVTNRTQLTDSRVLGVVERWSTQSFEMPVAGSPPPPPPPRPDHLASGSSIADSDAGKKSSDTSEDSDTELDTKPASATVDSSSVDDVSMDSVDVEQDALKSKPSLEGCMAEDDSSDSNLSDENKEVKKRSAVEPGEGDGAATAAPEDEATMQELLNLHGNMVELADKLLEQWRTLKEYFRIPKKERIELMKEHEREVEEEIRGLDKDRKEKDKYKRDFDRRRRSPDREKDKDQRHSRRRSDRDAREDRSSDSPKMSKEQRRQLFEIQVQQEEEEAKQRKMQEEMWAMHVDRCRLLGQDPYLTPIFDPTCQYYWDPNTAAWQRYNGADPNLPVPAAYGHLVNGSGEGSPMLVSMPPGSVIAAQPIAGHIASDGEAATPNYDDPRIDPSTIPLPGEAAQTSPTQPIPCQAVPAEGTPPQGARVLTFPVPGGETGAVNPAVPISIGTSAVAVPFVVGEEAPPPPPPGPITIQLPPRWKMARDSEGHVYFYHVKTRTSQWEPPTLEQHQQLEASLGSESDSESSSSDSESTSTTDSEDFSSDEEEEKELVQVTTVERGELSEEKMIRRHRAKKPRSEALVQERVISPVMEIDKETARRERREAKERAQKEVRQERQEDRLMESTQDMLDANDDDNVQSERLQKTERSEVVLERERHEHRESKMKSRDRTKSKERAANAIADNSDAARKCKENFRAKMATYIVSVLNPYRRDDCKIGRITCNEDFKYLARKLTHFVMIKELKQLHSVEDLECNDSVKYKTKDFVRKYMSKYGHEFKRDPTDTKEY